MTDDDMKFLGDELHELADGISPSSSSAARDRARHGIARRARNRRAAAGAAGVVVLVAGTVFFAVDRDTKDSRRPLGTTTSSESTAPTSTSSTAAPSTTVPGSPIVSTIPALGELPAATASYAQGFSWVSDRGRGGGPNDGNVAFRTPQGEGASGGPLAFTATADLNIAMLDHSSSRIVRYSHGASPAVHLSLTSPAVTAAAFDSKGRVIVATVGDIAVFHADGSLLAEFPAMSIDAITQLEVDGGGLVYSVVLSNGS